MKSHTAVFKNLSLIFAIFFSIAGFGNVDAQDVTLSFPELVTGEPGDQFSVDVTASDLSDLGIFNFDMEMSYDPSLLTITTDDISGGDLVSGSVTANVTDDGRILVNFASSQEFEGSGSLFTISGTLADVGNNPEGLKVTYIFLGDGSLNVTPSVPVNIDVDVTVNVVPIEWTVSPQTIDLSGPEATTDEIGITQTAGTEPLTWELSSSVNWLSFPDGTTGTGSPSVALAIEENTQAASREGVITITTNAGTDQVTVTQPGVPVTDELIEVSGVVDFNTTWTAELSPYSVVGDVQIPEGVTLSIEPGVEVRYTGDFEMLVQGNIIANGTEADSIVFTGNDSGIGAVQVRFEGTNLDNSEISYVRMERASRAIQVGKETEHDQGGKNTGTLRMSHVSIIDADVVTDGYDTEAVLELEHVNIVSSQIKGTYPRSEPIRIRHGVVENSTIASDSYNKGILLEELFVSNSTLTIGCCGANIEIVSSTVTGSAIHEGGGNPVRGPLQISDSEFINTGIDLPATQVIIGNTSFTHADQDNITGPVVRFGNGSITGSELTGSEEGTGIEVTGRSGRNIGGSVEIRQTVISDYEVGVRITGANVIEINENEFSRNGRYNIENRSAKNVDASDNWWGTIDVLEIREKIGDNEDNINYGRVTFSPLLMSADGPLNHVPEVAVDVTPVLGRKPLEVTFIASADDQDGTVEEYAWDFTGDGDFEYISPDNGNTTYTYEEGGLYFVELSVTDDLGLSNRNIFGIAVIDFEATGTQNNDNALLSWGWGDNDVIGIEADALSQLKPGNEIHVIDKNGINTDSCPDPGEEEDEYGLTSVGNIPYDIDNDSLFIIPIEGAIDLCDFNGEISSGFIQGNEMYFMAYNSELDKWYNLKPLVMDTGNGVFGDSVITVISSFKIEEVDSGLATTSNTNNKMEKSGSDSIKAGQNFNIYRDGSLLEANIFNTYYIDTDVAPLSDYTYSIELVNSKGEENIQYGNFVVSTGIFPPTSPSLHSPSSNGTGFTTPLTLRWNSSKGAVYYRVQLSTKNDFTDLLSDTLNIEHTSITFDGLEHNQFYYWRVRAYNEGGASNWSDIWRFKIETYTSIEPEMNVPKKIILEQNYPNPFNPSTTISYGLPKASEVQIVVFNMLGKRVAILVKEKKMAGWHTTNFDASNLSSGMYIYRIQADDFVKTEKMILIK